MFLWKPWINKLVTLCSHDHFQFEFHLISQFFLFNWPRTFSGEICLQKKWKNWFHSIFKSLNVIVSFYTDKLFTQVFSRFSLDMAAGNTPTLQCKAAVSSVRKLLRVHSSTEKQANCAFKHWKTSKLGTLIPLHDSNQLLKQQLMVTECSN